MADGNGSYPTRAELAAHIKGIDQRFEGIEADMSEVKLGIHGIWEELRRRRKARTAFAVTVSVALLSGVFTFAAAALFH